MESGKGSVSQWLDQLQAGSALAAEQLWQRYFHRLVGLARQQLHGAACPSGDEEDVALSVFDSFCRAAGQGRFPEMTNRDNLWRLLVVMTARKAANLRRDEGRYKRGGGKQALRDEAPEESPEVLLQQVLSREPTPEQVVQMREECERLLRGLGDDELRTVALWRLEGYTIEEIAARLGCVERSVKRRLRLIRSIWERELAS
jgi:DNA-directed RNA polymerase specialized sigma24 family protein